MMEKQVLLSPSDALPGSEGIILEKIRETKPVIFMLRGEEQTSFAKINFLYVKTKKETAVQAVLS